jgi:tetratricopeptide (TPR) repeat protein
MVKQRRPGPKPTKASRPARRSDPATSVPAAQRRQVVQPTGAAQAAGGRQTGGRSSPSAHEPPRRRSTYFDAVAVYERGLDALQRHDYHQAIDLLESVLRDYPEEKELHERVRLYLNICRRQAAPREQTPVTVDERLYAATLAINAAEYDRAIAHLRLVRDEDPDNDHALYMLAVAHAQRGELAEAVAHLERAIAVNPENRGLARTDPDLEPLRGDEAFRSALEIPAGQRIIPNNDRRRPVKTRFGR